MTTAEEHNLIAKVDPVLLIDPFSDNQALNTDTQQLLTAIRMLPADSPHIIEHRAPTVAEIKAAPVIGYAPPKVFTMTQTEEGSA